MYKISFLLLLMTLKSYAISVPMTIELFTNNHYGVQNESVAKFRGFDLQVYNLDDPIELDKYLSSKLPSNLESARKEAKSRIENIPLITFQKAWLGISQAAKYELRSLPAIVINNGEAVLYGLTNIDMAIKQYQLWQKKQGK